MQQAQLKDIPSLEDDQETFFRKLFQRWTGQRFSYNDENFGFSELLQFTRNQNFNTVVELIMAIHQGDLKFAQALLAAFNNRPKGFFDDPQFYGFFDRALLAEMMTQSRTEKNVRIWSVGCGRGFETYSLAMAIHAKRAETNDWHLEVLGTDFQHEAVEEARLGRYTREECTSDTSKEYLEIGCKQINTDEFTIIPEVKKYTNFKVHNILDSFDELGTFNMISCRGLLKTMLPVVRESFLAKAYNCLQPGGYLALNNDESIMGLSSQYIPVDGCRGLYQKKNPPIISEGLSED